jgi:hypothetical protein
MRDIQATTYNLWETTTIDILIPHGIKEEVANQHLYRHFFTHADIQQLSFYTDGSQLNNKCGAGIYCNGGVQSKMGCSNATVRNLKPKMIT